MITNSVEEAILLSDRIVPMIPGPPLDCARRTRGVNERAPTTLGTPIPVDLPRPRTLAQLAHDEQATHARAHVIAALTAALGRKRATSPLQPDAASAVLRPVAEEPR